jgi:hypothetical protein
LTISSFARYEALRTAMAQEVNQMSAVMQHDQQQQDHLLPLENALLLQQRYPSATITELHNNGSEATAGNGGGRNNVVEAEAEYDDENCFVTPSDYGADNYLANVAQASPVMCASAADVGDDEEDYVVVPGFERDRIRMLQMALRDGKASNV